MSRKRKLLRLEQLEDRCVPTVTSTFYNGSLYLTGSTQGKLAITGVGSPSQFTVTDNGSPVGAGLYNITSNLNINLSLEKGDVKIDLHGETIGGNVVLGLGVGEVGAQNVDIYDSLSTGAIGGLGTGTIGGSVTIAQGNGKEAFGIGVDTSGPTQNPLTINGGLTIAASPSNSSITGNGLQIGDGTNIFGSVNTTYVSNVSIGSSTPGNALATISQSVTINDGGSLCHLSVVDVGVIDHNLSVVGTTLDDSFTLNEVTTGGGFIGGTANINLAQGQTVGDRITLGENTEIDGNTSLSAGDDLSTVISGFGDKFTIQGMILLNLTVTMGNTTNYLIFTPVSGAILPSAYVGGNMSVTAGNGTNFIGQMATGEFNGTVGQNLTFQLGSGNNGASTGPVVSPTTPPTDPMILAPMLMGKLTWTSGNGTDYLQLGDSIAGNPSTGNTYNYNVNIHFGTKFCYFAIDLGAAGLITGVVNSMNPTDWFNTISGSTGSPFSTNFWHTDQEAVYVSRTRTHLAPGSGERET